MNLPDQQPNRRILIVDDNPSIHADFQKILCPAGTDKTAVQNLKAALFDKAPAAAPADKFDLTSAYQGQEALEMVKQSLADERPYAMAFVDVRMPPGWDGIETIARIWEVDPELQVVVCTAYSDYSWEAMRSKVGQPDSLLVLKKPFDNIEVQQLAHALTKKWMLNRQSALQLTALSQANQSLVLSEERFSKAFHESPLPSGIANLASRRFVDVNQRFAEIAGWKREEMIGKTSAELALWEKPEEVEQWVACIRRMESVRERETNIRTQDGALHEVQVSMSPVMLDNTPHALVLAQDVAERAFLERELRQAQKMEAIGQLAAGVAHDFNNILTVIQGYAGLLRYKAEAASPQVHAIDQITKASASAAALIRQLLMFSRKQVMRFQHLDLNQTLSTSIRMLERLVGEHIQIVLRSHEPLSTVHADASMVEQIVMNLAVNARDAMPKGGRICISTSVEAIRDMPKPMAPEARAGDYVCLKFEDNGQGMEPHVLNRIFEPFFTTKAVGKGTGLGLSTVFGIVRQHHGWIEVDSEPQKGTAFRIYFPASTQTAASTEIVDDNKLHAGRETVLVAEDEEPLREMVAQVLRIQGYNVLEAESGAHALEVWEQAKCPVDLLITDMVMPGGVMGGDLADRLMSRSSSLRVIYTSGYSPGMAGKDTSLLMSTSFLPKPYSIGKLAQFVRQTLDAPVKRPCPMPAAECAEVS